MKEVVKLMDYRPDIKIVDATLRDGGLVNNFRFTDEFVKDLYQTNIKAGVDVMEFGYKADKEMFDVKDFGKWKFCDDEDIRAVVGDNNTDLKIAVMADVGRCNYKQDIKPRAESPVDVIRVATYINQIPAAVDVIEDAVAKGYEVTCNIMAISNAQEADIRVALDLLGKSPVNVIYIVDSFGALFPEQIMHFFRDDAEVTRIGRQALLYACAVMPLMGYSTYVNQLYQCLGFHQAATLLASCRNGLLYVPLILILPRMLGLPGVEMSQPGADLLTFVVSLPFQIWFFRHKLR